MRVLLDKIGTPYRRNPIIKSLKRDVTGSYQNRESFHKMECLNRIASSWNQNVWQP
jgi:hypothetical protein